MGPFLFLCTTLLGGGVGFQGIEEAIRAIASFLPLSRQWWCYRGRWFSSLSLFVSVVKVL